MMEVQLAALEVALCAAAARLPPPVVTDHVAGVL
jgi:hypothetical protein